MSLCLRCGKRILPGARYCTRCGLAVQSAGMRYAPYQPRSCNQRRVGFGGIFWVVGFLFFAAHMFSVHNRPVSASYPIPQPSPPPSVTHIYRQPAAPWPGYYSPPVRTHDYDPPSERSDYSPHTGRGY